MLYGKPAWAEIDFDLVGQNCRQVKAWIGDSTEFMATVKANAYGLGAVPVAKVALQNGATRLAVARVDEGIQLREAGIDVPILVLGYVPAEEMQTAVRWRITPPVMHWHTAKALSEASVSQGVTTPVHVKVDTGLARFGLLPDEVVGFIRQLIKLPGLYLEGIYTHFGVPDEAEATHAQFRIFGDVVKQIEAIDIRIPICHVCDSGATLNYPEMHLDMVRPGGLVYGYYPSQATRRAVALHFALSLRCRVARVRTLPAGVNVGYGKTYVTTQPTTVALVSFGYADFLSQRLSNKGFVLIRGKRAPIVGRMSYSQTTVDVSGISGVEQDDEVVVLGAQGEEEITLDELGAVVGCTKASLLPTITARVPRVYIKGGKIVEVVTLTGKA